MNTCTFTPQLSWQQVKPPLGTQTKRIIEYAKGTLNISLKEHEQEMLQAEFAEKLEFVFLGKNIVRVEPVSKQRYNAYLKLQGKTIYFLYTNGVQVPKLFE